MAEPGWVEPKGDTIRALGRGLEVLALFGSGRPEITLTETARLTGLPLPTTQRILKTLEAHRFVTRGSDRGPYRLGPALLPLLPPLFGSMTLPEIAEPYVRKIVEPYVRKIVDATGENANLAVLDGRDVLYLVNHSGGGLLTVNTAPGLRLPLHCTALGKVLLAQTSDTEAKRLLGKEPYEAYTDKTLTTWARMKTELAEVRANKSALSLEEFEDGLCSVALPVSTTWPAPAAVNISAPLSRWTDDYLADQLLPALEQAAEDMSAAFTSLGGSASP